MSEEEKPIPPVVNLGSRPAPPVRPQNPSPPTNNKKNNALPIVICCVLVAGMVGSTLDKKPKGSSVAGSVAPRPTPTPLSPEEAKKQKEQEAKQVAENKRLKQIADKKRIAEEEKINKQIEAAEKASQRKAEEEDDHDGLVLMRKTVKGKTGEYGNKSITGIVENRTGKRLTYAQIQYSLVDKSGAQVGTALANINNLENGQKWRFNAGILHDDAVGYRLSELSGF